MHRRAGFSLIELMIAIAIIGVGAVLAMPMLTSLMEKSRLTTTTNNIVEALATARSEAIRGGQAVAVVPVGGDWTAGWEVQVAADGTILSRFDAIPDPIVVTASEAFASIEFQPSGMRTNTVADPAAAATLTVCGTGPEGREVQLHISGSTKINPADCP